MLPEIYTHSKYLCNKLNISNIINYNKLSMFLSLYNELISKRISIYAWKWFMTSVIKIILTFVMFS
jgi:hypothetical protein